jgi:hypothetical protein
MKTAEPKLTGGNRENREGNQNLCSLRLLLLNSGRDGGGKLDFNLLTSEGVNTYSKRDKGCVLVEAKAVEKILPIHKAQLLSYMKLLDVPVGFAH